MQDAPLNHAASQSSMSPAMLRMTRSRIALRQVLHHGSDAKLDKPSSEHGAGNTFDNLFGLLKDQPTAQLLLQAAQGMWAKNPWMIFGKNAFEASNILLLPIAQRSPVKLVAGAFVLGAVLCIARPWRLVKKSNLIASFFAR